MTSSDGANNNHVKLSEAQLVRSEFGASLEDCYKLAVKFYKEQEKSGELAIQYDDRVKLMALSKQVRLGPFASSEEGAGWFDFVGSDMNRSWKDLGSTDKEDAMASFVFLVDRVCPPFKGFVQDQIAGDQQNECSALKDLSISNNAAATSLSQAATTLTQQPNYEIFEQQRKQIQDALNSQTFHQFSAYAQQQFPGQGEQQAALIRQLQEQHYQQYMAQVYAQQAEAAAPGKKTNEDERAHDDDSDVSDEEPGDDLPSNPAIAPASLWNRQDINEFKANIKKEGSEGILKVGHGETVTVRVPTHEDGTCLFWEFSTDHYDIGFGVYFEWTIAESNQVSIHVSESDEDEEFEEGIEAPPPVPPGEGDVESGGGNSVERRRDPNKPKVDEIIPVYRRDCHEEVYAGSHVYPGRGVYLLKFDNSFSLWRSKTLYYRVYYSK